MNAKNHDNAIGMKALSDNSCITVLSTPIGNLADMSQRGRDALAAADLILAEDTRVTRKLLSLLGITGKTVEIYNDHSDEKRRREILKRLKTSNLNVVLVSDAGTPCISDPGYKLIRAARSEGLCLTAVPGPSAPITLAAMSGLPTSRLVFMGFLPSKEKAVRDEITFWSGYREHSVLFFDSVNRIERDLKIIAEFFPEAEFAVGRELTKRFEEVQVGSSEDIIRWLEDKESLKGELTVMVYLPLPPAVVLTVSEFKTRYQAEIGAAFSEGQSLRDLREVYADKGLARKELYKVLLELKEF
ncbi:16S rRNA (cytidine(1402)-2'-O)-methyltransferase [Oligoflexaceae bacterium]|nr:16S rRNA (cytidine(1402)-2'-O)-methyltransferase [Oligoflexaceae bacterium]